MSFRILKLNIDLLIANFIIDIKKVFVITEIQRFLIRKQFFIHLSSYCVNFHVYIFMYMYVCIHICVYMQAVTNII